MGFWGMGAHCRSLCTRQAGPVTDARGVLPSGVCQASRHQPAFPLLPSCGICGAGCRSQPPISDSALGAGGGSWPRLLTPGQCALSPSHRVRLSVAPWTEAHQAPPSMGPSRQGDWSGLPCSAPGDRPSPGIEPESPVSPALAGGFLTTSTTWEACWFFVSGSKQPPNSVTYREPFILFFLILRLGIWAGHPLHVTSVELGKPGGLPVTASPGLVAGSAGVVSLVGGGPWSLSSCGAAAWSVICDHVPCCPQMEKGRLDAATSVPRFGSWWLRGGPDQGCAWLRGSCVSASSPILLFPSCQGHLGFGESSFGS